MKTLRLSFLVSTVLAVAFGIFVLFQTVTIFFVIPPQPKSSVVLFIKPSTTVRAIARQLYESGVITSQWKFRLLAKLKGVDKHLKPGEYKFESPSAPIEAIHILAEGKVILHKVTIPEGSTMEDIARAFAAQKLLTVDTFRAVAARKDLKAKLNVPGLSLEGFLFPETYFFSKVDEPEKMIFTMVSRFKQMTTPEDLRRAQALKFSLLEWVTFASIVEKESSIASEQPLVSSVFHNRLKKNMRLQSDPTVIYGIKNFNGNITKKDLQTATEYNTYTRAGLPPGPIANPGASALKAALYPAQTDFLYFVANRNGSHVFSKTYEEHLKYVAQYQLNQKKR
jgi:UPF0755 protein